ncbi:glycosyltransferase [Francisella philomiragia]|nr:glycosyltransferase [Francisella philomiragia]
MKGVYPKVPPTAYVRMVDCKEYFETKYGFKVEFISWDNLLDSKLISGYARVTIQRDAIPAEKVDECLKQLKKHNVPYTYEIDDNLLEVPDVVDTAGNYKKYKNHFISLIQNADDIHVTNDYLANIVKRYNNNIVIRPNTILKSRWSVDQVNRIDLNVDKSKINVIYYGSKTHQDDLDFFIRVLEQLNQKQYQMHLYVIGCGDFKNDKYITRLTPPTSRYDEFVSWLVKISHNFDFGIAPLIESEFSKSKSYLKAIEYDAMGLRCICSDIKPYSDLDKSIYKNVYYAKNTIDDWIATITKLSNDKDKLKVDRLACFVLGMHRSGTSALAGTLHYFGFDYGSDLMPLSDGNPKGYFENNLVYQHNRYMMSQAKANWDTYTMTVDDIPKEKQQEYIKKAEEILKSEFANADKIAIKDPRICILFPIWEQACKNLGIDIKIIIPYRNPTEVAMSLETRNKFSHQKSYLIWAHHFLMAELQSRSYPRIFTSFDSLITDTDSTLEVLSQFLDISITDEMRANVDDFLDKDIKNNNQPIESFTKNTPRFLQLMIKAIREKDFENPKLFNGIHRELKMSIELFQHQEFVQANTELNTKVTQLTQANQNIQKDYQNLQIELDSLKTTIAEIKTQTAIIDKIFADK